MALDEIQSAMNIWKDVSNRLSRPSSEGERWLAALEQNSFHVGDDALDRHMPGQHQQTSLATTALPVQHPDSHPPISPVRSPSIPFSVPESAGSGTRPDAAFDQTRLDPRGRHFQMPGHGSASGPAPARGAELERLVSPRGVFSSQARFKLLSDLNVQVIENEDGITIWIRDYKAAYGPELHAWLSEIQELGVLPGSIGSDVRLMLNGEQLKELSDILRVK